VDTATTYEAITLDSGQGTDGRYPCHCISKLECFHWLELLGSGMFIFRFLTERYADFVLVVLSELPAIDTGRNYDPIHSHVHCRLFVQLFRGDGRCQVAIGYLCRQVSCLCVEY
jgi:hypothetical protein